MYLSEKENPQYGEPGIHISPYGEWRWSPMGLAGRDPIFYAQLESELALLEKAMPNDAAARQELGDQIMDTCLSCHGAMGRRQMDLDRAAGKPLPRTFRVEHVYNTSMDPHQTGHELFSYGALAREGVSCAVCHRMTAKPQPADDQRPYLKHFLETSITGNFQLGKPDELFGPYEDKQIAPYAMEHALGVKPKHNPFLKSSQMCGACHVINLPVLDRPRESHEPPDELIQAETNPHFRGFKHHVEQATYLEWLNSKYDNELTPNNPEAKTCQDCHMPKSYQDPDFEVASLGTRIAAIQDATYPEAENLAPLHDLKVRVRQGDYRRHTFQGLNGFLLEILRQYDDILGVRRHDFMTGSKTDLDQAIANLARQARRDVVEMTTQSQWNDQGRLQVEVRLLNKAGHRFPSGVGFRRAFLELLVVEKTDQGEHIVWSSGRTNEIGALLDDRGQVLPTEYHTSDAEGKPHYQPHHQQITSPQQVQIYEHLMTNAAGRVTTSFLHQSVMLKDNRLLPQGWSATGPDPTALSGEFLAATHPGERAAEDPRYADGSGSDAVDYSIALPAAVDRDRVEVRATLYYQSIPPFFLQQLFEHARMDRRPAACITCAVIWICRARHSKAGS